MDTTPSLHGDVLHRHLDRESCEVMTLGCGSKDRWPFYVEYDGNAQVVTMEPGDAVIYKDWQTHHWRYAFEGTYQVQMFFCFVDKNGPFADHKYDKRNVIVEEVEL